MKFNNRKITKRTDGRWFARYIDSNGKQKAVYAKTQKECYEKLKNQLSNEQLINKPGLILKNRKQRTLNSWIEEWLHIFKEPKNAPATIRKHQSIWDNWIRKQIGDRTMRSFTTLELQHYISDITYPRQREHVYVFIKDVFNKALNCNVIDKNPAILLDPPKHIHNEKRALSHDEEKIIVDELQNDSLHWPYFCLILYEGMRPGEVLALRPCDIHDDYLYISQTKDELANYKTTKNRKQRRIPIFAQAKDVCNKLRSSSTDIIYAKYHHGFAQDVLKRVCNKFNLSGISLYSLRHTFATRCAESNITAKQTQLWMGHSDVGVTLKYYTNINDEFEQSNVLKKK